MRLLPLANSNAACRSNSAKGCRGASLAACSRSSDCLAVLAQLDADYSPLVVALGLLLVKLDGPVEVLDRSVVLL